MTTPPMGYVSVVFLSLLETIISLVETLESRKLVLPNEVQASQPENGLSTSIAALSVFLLESAINRTWYIRTNDLRHAIPEDTSRQPSQEPPADMPLPPRSAFLYFRETSTDKSLVSDVEELFALRDVIAHNHLWEADVEWDQSGNLRFASPPRLIEGFGNRRLRKVMHAPTRQTHRLKLNLFPSRIWRRDAYETFKKVVQALLSLEQMDRRYVYVSQQSFLFQGQIRGLNEVLSSVPTIEVA